MPSDLRDIGRNLLHPRFRGIGEGWNRGSYPPPSLMPELSLAGLGGAETPSICAGLGRRLLTAGRAFWRESALSRPIFSATVDCVNLVRDFRP